MAETGLTIKIFGDPSLRKKSKPVKKLTPGHRQLLSKMAQLMYESSGVGLAAPQVGVNECLIVVDTGEGLYKLVNPRIVEKKGRQAIEEGCLSVPGICFKVSRSKKIKLEALDEEGKPLTIDAQDLLACVFQHEIDHLKGKLIVDYASLLKKIQFKKKLALLKKKAKDEKSYRLLA